MIAAGSVSTWYVDGSVSEFVISTYNTAALRAAALEELRSAGLKIRALTITSNEGILTQSWAYRATATVETTIAHAQVSDIKSIVEGAFWRAADSPVTASQTRPAGAGPSAEGPPWGLLALAVIAIALAVTVTKVT